MRILYLSQLVPYPPDAGPKVRIFHVLQYLVQAGHQVTLAAFSRDNDGSGAVDHLKKMGIDVHTVPMKRSKVRDTWHLGRSLLSGQPLLIVRDRVAHMHETIQVLASQNTYDFVHADQLWMAQYALGARAYLNGRGSTIALVLDQHNAVYLIPKRLAESETNPIKRILLNREASVMRDYESTACDQFDQVVWVTDEDRRALGQDSGDKLARGITIPICVDRQAKSLIIPNDTARRVTFLGGLHWPPNAAGITWFTHEVWPRIVEQAPGALLTIIGKQPPEALLSAPVDPETIDITGYVPDLTPYLQETAVFIVPLHAGGGMRVKILDAWSWGLPVVSTTIGAEGLHYHHNENLVIGDSANTFTDAVVRIIQDPDLAKRIGRTGRLTVEKHYDWRQTYRAWDQIYGKA